MSTRCNVLLHSPNGARVYFYRHSDGYLSMAGARLFHTFTAASVATKDGFPWIGDFAERLLRAQTESGSSLYQMTSGVHVDINYFYAIEFPGFAEDVRVPMDDPQVYQKHKALVKIRWAHGYGPGLEAEALAKPPQSLDEFWKDVARNADREDAETE